MRKKVYFIHPSITYNTRTEKSVITMIKEKIKAEIREDVEVISPSKLSRDRIMKWKEEVAMCTAVVGMALEGKYTISVWTVLDYAEERKIPVYTVMVNEGGHIWKEGVVKDIEKLSLEESDQFARELVYGFLHDIFGRIIFGGRRKY